MANLRIPPVKTHKTHISFYLSITVLCFLSFWILNFILSWILWFFYYGLMIMGLCLIFGISLCISAIVERLVREGEFEHDNLPRMVDKVYEEFTGFRLFKSMEYWSSELLFIVKKLISKNV